MSLGGSDRVQGIQSVHRSIIPSEYLRVDCAIWTLSDAKNNGLHDHRRAKHDMQRSLRSADLACGEQERCELQRSRRRPAEVLAGGPHESHRASAVLHTEDTTHARDPSLGQAAQRCDWSSLLSSSRSAAFLASFAGSVRSPDGLDPFADEGDS